MVAQVPRGRKYREARRRILDGATNCTWCGIEISDELERSHPQKATADHLVAVKEGGQDVVENLVPACFKCNSRRQDRDPSVLGFTVPGAEDW